METLLPAFLFAAIMLATVLVAAMPVISIRILETCRFYKRGKLQTGKRNYVDGEGKHVYRRVYLYQDTNGAEKFANLQVFIRLLFLCVMFCLILLVVYLMFISG